MRSNIMERGTRVYIYIDAVTLTGLTLLCLHFKHFKMENLTSVAQHKSSQISYVGIMTRIMMIIHGRESFTQGQLRYFIRHVSENKACFNLLNPKSSWTRHASCPLKEGWHRNMDNKK